MQAIGMRWPRALRVGLLLWGVALAWVVVARGRSQPAPAGVTAKPRGKRPRRSRGERYPPLQIDARRWRHERERCLGAEPTKETAKRCARQWVRVPQLPFMPLGNAWQRAQALGPCPVGAISEVIDGHVDVLAACYEQRYASAERLQLRTVETRFTVDARGQPRLQRTPQTDATDRELTACVETQLLRWRFAAACATLRTGRSPGPALPNAVARSCSRCPRTRGGRCGRPRRRRGHAFRSNHRSSGNRR